MTYKMFLFPTAVQFLYFGKKKNKQEKPQNRKTKKGKKKPPNDP